MKRIKEVMTVLTSGDEPGAVRVKREEHEPISDERFGLVVKSAARIVVAVVGAAVAINVDGSKLLILAGAGLFLALIYFGLRD